MPGFGVTFRVAPLANVTGTAVAPLSVPKADVGLTFKVKPDVVGAGEAATVPSRACSRSFTLLARSGGVFVVASAPMAWPFSLWGASTWWGAHVAVAVPA